VVVDMVQYLILKQDLEVQAEAEVVVDLIPQHQ
jgi:hypothetical protein